MATEKEIFEELSSSIQVFAKKIGEDYEDLDKILFYGQFLVEIGKLLQQMVQSRTELRKHDYQEDSLQPRTS